MILYLLSIQDDSGVKYLKDDDLEYLKGEKRRHESMGEICKIEKVAP